MAVRRQDRGDDNSSLQFPVSGNRKSEMNVLVIDDDKSVRSGLADLNVVQVEIRRMLEGLQTESGS